MAKICRSVASFTIIERPGSSQPVGEHCAVIVAMLSSVTETNRRLDECVGLTGPCRATMAWRRTVWLGDLGVGWIGVRFKVNPP